MIVRIKYEFVSFAATYSFPYVLKRIPVKRKQAIELNPIEVAIDEMQNRVCELEEVVMPPIDVKKLQLRLQGSIAVTVNAGPLAYASAFLDPKQNEGKYSEDKVDELKDIFRYEIENHSIFDIRYSITL